MAKRFMLEPLACDEAGHQCVLLGTRKEGGVLLYICTAEHEESAKHLARVLVSKGNYQHIYLTRYFADVWSPANSFVVERFVTEQVECVW